MESIGCARIHSVINRIPLMLLLGVLRIYVFQFVLRLLSDKSSCPFTGLKLLLFSVDGNFVPAFSCFDLFTGVVVWCRTLVFGFTVDLLWIYCILEHLPNHNFGLLESTKNLLRHRSCSEIVNVVLC